MLVRAVSVSTWQKIAGLRRAAGRSAGTESLRTAEDTPACKPVVGVVTKPSAAPCSRRGSPVSRCFQLGQVCSCFQRRGGYAADLNLDDEDRPEKRPRYPPGHGAAGEHLRAGLALRGPCVSPLCPDPPRDGLTRSISTALGPACQGRAELGPWETGRGPLSVRTASMRLGRSVSAGWRRPAVRAPGRTSSRCSRSARNPSESTTRTRCRARVRFSGVRDGAEILTNRLPSRPRAGYLQGGSPVRRGGPGAATCNCPTATRPVAGPVRTLAHPPPTNPPHALEGP